MTSLLVLSWNLFHGRAVPPVDRSLFDQFAAKLDEWSWDVALLQEAPPWWPQRLADELRVAQRNALTSRNSLLPLRRALAERRPELLKSNGGGCNAILSRAPIAEHNTLRLRRWPERRVAQLARMGDGTCVVNLHASTRPARARQELEWLWPRALAWAGSDRLILGGDLNVRSPPPAPAAIVHAAASGVDHVFARGLVPAPAGGSPSGTPAGASDADDRLSRAVVLDGRRVELSDHAPLLVPLRAEAGSRTTASR
jgi:endonuclease/exonuclease/phosphatase family metal-dependent hydrolase